MQEKLRVRVLVTKSPVVTEKMVAQRESSEEKRAYLKQRRSPSTWGATHFLWGSDTRLLAWGSRHMHRCLEQVPDRSGGVDEAARVPVHGGGCCH